MATEGTASILDITHVSRQPAVRAVCPLSDQELNDHFGTTQPTREQVTRNMAFMDDIGRGEGRFIVTYVDGRPTEILFCGYSFD
jgi:hypothetical protein